MRHKKRVYLENDPFCGSDRDVNVRCHTAKIVTVRKSHPCVLADLIGNEFHSINPGEKARRDKAIVEGEWGSYYTCIPCMDKWLSEDVGII